MTQQTDASSGAASLTENIARLSISVHIAVAETKNRYARSLIGPIWITIQTALFVMVVGNVVSQVFNQDFGFFFSWFSISFVMWTFLSGLVLDASQQFVSVAGLIKDRGIDPRSFLLLSFSRQIILILHTLVVPIAIILVAQTVSFTSVLMAIPGFLLFFLFCGLLAPVIAVVSVKYRDARPILESFMQIMFLISPVLWPTAVFQQNAPFALLINPISHLMAIWREPLFRGQMPWDSFAFVSLLVSLLFIAVTRLDAPTRRVAVWL